MPAILYSVRVAERTAHLKLHYGHSKFLTALVLRSKPLSMTKFTVVHTNEVTWVVQHIYAYEATSAG